MRSVTSNSKELLLQVAIVTIATIVTIVTIVTIIL